MKVSLRRLQRHQFGEKPRPLVEQQIQLPLEADRPHRVVDLRGVRWNQIVEQQQVAADDTWVECADIGPFTDMQGRKCDERQAEGAGPQVRRRDTNPAPSYERNPTRKTPVVRDSFEHTDSTDKIRSASRTP